MTKLNYLNIKPFWDESTAPDFIRRTDVVYSKVKLSELKGRNIENRMFDSLIEGLPEGCYIAGGFMVNLLLQEKNAKDIDIFCNSAKAFAEVCNMLLDASNTAITEDDKLWAWKGYKCTTDLEAFEKGTETFRFIKFEHEKRPAIQILKLFWYKDVPSLIDTFDFTATQVGCDKEHIYLNPLTQFDLAKKRLVLHRMQFPASTMRRMIKYSAKGFYVCPGSLINITKEIQNHRGGADINDKQFVYLD